MRIVVKEIRKLLGNLFPHVSVFGSYIVLLYLLIRKKRNQIFFLPTSALGDFVYVLSFWPLIEKKYQNKELVFFASERYKRIIECNKVNAKIVYLKHLGVKHLLLFMLSYCPHSPHSVNIALRNNIIPCVAISHKKEMKRQGIVGTRNQLARVFGVPAEPVFHHKVAIEKVHSIPEFEKNKNRICIINPYSTSMDYSVSLYEKICEELRSRNFIVYTNVVGEQKEIKGSLPLQCSVEELFSIASQIPLFVSVRSGILDFLIPSNVPMFVIYEMYYALFNGSNPKEIAKNYSLREWCSKGVVHEVFWDNLDKENDILLDFQSFLEAHLKRL